MSALKYLAVYKNNNFSYIFKSLNARLMLLSNDRAIFFSN